MTTHMKLSVIIPIYNERETIGRVLVAVFAALPDVPKELVLVDDGSRDGTREWLDANVPASDGWYRNLCLDDDGALHVEPATAEGAGAVSFQLHRHESNRGKGAAMQTGLRLATGEVLVVQDADLEYDPKDWARMYPLIAEQGVADVVYGSRFYGYAHRSLNFHHYMGNRIISFLFNLLYNQTLSDIEVCYKMFSRDVLKSLRLTSKDFGFEVEISAQIARARKWRIYEVGIHYFGRTIEEGKKINWKDGVKALWYLLKYRSGKPPWNARDIGCMGCLASFLESRCWPLPCVT